MFCRGTYLHTLCYQDYQPDFHPPPQMQFRTKLDSERAILKKSIESKGRLVLVSGF